MGEKMNTTNKRYAIEKESNELVEIIRSHAKTVGNKRAIEFKFVQPIQLRTVPVFYKNYGEGLFRLPVGTFKKLFTRITDEEMTDVLYGRETV
jgi:hypothetical protein